jgi:hypothetical protein
MKMPYGDRRRNSGISHYEPGPSWIRVWFRGEPKYYEYSNRKVGSAHVKEMMRLARDGKGLTTYINQHPKVRDGYTREQRPKHAA